LDRGDEMKVIITGMDSEVELKNLKYGDVFKDGNFYYMLVQNNSIEVESDQIMAVALDDFELIVFNKDDEVLPTTARLIVNAVKN
jgi:hypothetical protein